MSLRMFSTHSNSEELLIQVFYFLAKICLLNIGSTFPIKNQARDFKQ